MTTTAIAPGPTAPSAAFGVLTAPKMRVSFDLPVGQAKLVEAELRRQGRFHVSAALKGDRTRVQIWAEDADVVKALVPTAHKRAVPLTPDDAGWFLAQDNKFLLQQPSALTRSMNNADDIAPTTGNPKNAAIAFADVHPVQQRTEQEIIDLIENWKSDPAWDLETTEGFEAHADRLRAVADEQKAIWEAARVKRLTALAEKLGAPGNVKLAQYVEVLEYRIEEMGRRLDKGNL